MSPPVRMISSTNVMSERDGEHVPRRAPEPRLVVVLEAARLVPPAVFELVERAAP